MDSRLQAESADVRARRPSRRFVLAGGSAAPFVTGAAGDADPEVARCARWLAIDAEQRRLQLEWGTLEGFGHTSKPCWIERKSISPPKSVAQHKRRG